MIKNFRPYCSLVLALLLIGGLTACETLDFSASEPATVTPSETAIAPEPVKTEPTRRKVALLLPLSGTDRTIGEAMLNAAQMALTDLGADNIELIPKDTGAKIAGEAPQKITLAAQEAVAEGADIVLGPVYSNTVAQAKPIIASAQIPMVTFSNDGRLAGHGTYVLGPLQYDQVATVLTYAKQQNRKKIAVIAGNDDYGNAIVSAANTYAQQNNLPAPQIIRLVEEGASGWRSILGKYFVVGSEPEAVLIAFRGGALSAVSQTLTSMGFPPSRLQRLGVSSWFEKTIPNSSALEGGVVAAPDAQFKQRFAENYTQLFKSAPPPLAGYAYDAVAMAAILAKQGAPYTPANIANPSGFIGTDGLFRFLPNGLNQRSLALWQFTGGQMKIIQPAAAAF